jgi:hypothetical protein
MTLNPIAVKDPVHEVMVDAFANVPHLKTNLLVNYIMGHLPGTIPGWADADMRRGVAGRVQQELNREFVFEDRHGVKQRVRKWVPISGYYHPFTGLTLDGYLIYIKALKKSVSYDQDRIKFHEDQYNDLKGRATATDVLGDLLGIA